MAALELNKEQELALGRIVHWLEHGDNPMFVLSGSAGTGKTFTCRHLFEAVSDKHRIAFSAPTNKAVKVLRASFEDAGASADSFSTTYSLLGLKLQANGAVKEIKSGTGKSRARNYDLIIVDEGSMVNTVLMEHLGYVVDSGRTKILFMGDPVQLPPVGEVTSPIWLHDTIRASLHDVMRHDNQILALCSSIRDHIQRDTVPRIVNDNSNREGVFMRTRGTFEKYVREVASQRNDFQNGKTKVIAWRNKTVGYYNDIIRREVFGQHAPRFSLDERVVFASPLVKSYINNDGDEVQTTLASIDEEGSVLAVRNGMHPFYEDIAVLFVDIVLDLNGETVTATVLDDADERKFNSRLEKLANEKNWWAFWQMKEAFNDVRYAYAITSHRAQGSTYETVFVVMEDIFVNRNKDEAWRSFYVACSRPSRVLVLDGG